MGRVAAAGITMTMITTTIMRMITRTIIMATSTGKP
jgi:hypothetical protein